MSLLIPSDHGKMLRDFLAVPEQVYGEDPRYVPEPEYFLRRMLSVRGNSFCGTAGCELVVVECGGRPSARASLVFPREFREEALFGYVECIRDPGVFARLVEQMEERCHRRGVRKLVGPFSPDAHGVTGLQMDAFDSPRVFFEANHPGYYAEMFFKAGFRVLKTGRAWRGKTPQLSRNPPSTRSGGYRVRTLATATVREALGAISSVYNRAFTENWYYRPLVAPEYRSMALALLPTLSRRLVQWVELDGIAVGAAILLRDISGVLGRRPPSTMAGTLSRVWRLRKRITGVTVLAVGMLPAHRHSRGGHLLYENILHALAPYRHLTTTWITEGNQPSEAVAAHLGMRPYKTFAVLAKSF